MAENVTAQLSKKMGPLPVGVWIVVVGAGLGIGFFLNRKQSTQDTSPPVQDPGVGVGGSGWVDVPPPAKPAPVAETNMTWAIKASNWLIAQGYPPLSVGNAVNKYIFSTPLSPQEKAWVDQAVKQFGVPPDPLPPVDQPETPKPDTAPPPVTGLRSEPYTTNSVLLLWNKSEGATHYQIDGIEGASHSIITFDTNAVVTWLQQGRSYTFRVRALRGTAASDWREVSASVRGGGEYQPGPPGRRTHIVQNGDTLWDLAVRYYGNGFKAPKLYGANSGVIEAAARAHGRSSSRMGMYLYVGTILTLP